MKVFLSSNEGSLGERAPQIQVALAANDVGVKGSFDCASASLEIP